MNRRTRNKQMHLQNSKNANAEKQTNKHTNKYIWSRIVFWPRILRLN